jgi:hypothetical protein
VLDSARQAPLSEGDYNKLKGALHAMAALLVPMRTTEKMSAVVGDSADAEPSGGGQNDRLVLHRPSARRGEPGGCVEHRVSTDAAVRADPGA